MSTITGEFKAMAKETGAKFGVYVGRLCPVHPGHQSLIQCLIEAFPQKHVVFVGSCNHPLSIRNLFNYLDRTSFLKVLFPSVKVAPLPDFEDDATWFAALDDMLESFGTDPQKTVYIGGSAEDVEFYYRHDRPVHIINRFDGTTQNISASEIRDALIEKRSLEGLLDDRIIPMVQRQFALRWSEMRSR
jgi:nicotinic acid mononucleotide adenylyltransferase